MTPKEKEASSDFIISLLKMNVEEAYQKDLEIEEIRAILNDLYLGITDTTISTLSMMFFHLTRNLNIQEKLSQELDSLIQAQGEFNKDSISHLKYLDAVVSETFRYQTTVPYVTRTPDYSEPVKIGLNLRQGELLMISIEDIHRNANYFPNPDLFDPERFLGPGKKNYSYVIPFGGGRRTCPGQALGLLTVKLIASLMLSKFSFKPADRSVTKLQGKTNVTFNVDDASTLTLVEKKN
jgi:cytochrome P450